MKIFNKLSLFALSLTAVAGTTIGGFSKVANSVNAEVEASSTTKYVKVEYVPSTFSGEYALGLFEAGGNAKIWNGNSDVSNFVSSSFSNKVLETDSSFVTLSFNSMDNETYSIKVNGGDNDGKYLTVSSAKNTEIGFSDTEVAFTLTAKYENIGIKYSGTTANPYLRFYTDSNSSKNRFRFFSASSKGKSINLIKKITATTAEEWKTEFLDATTGTCNPDSPKPNQLASIWTVSKASFDNLPTEEQEKLSTLAVADDFKDAIERYEYIVRTYNIDTISDFIGRGIVTNANINLFRQNSSNNNVLILSFVALGVVSISLVSFFLVRRKRSK